jgi:RNase H-fold protein (predicted Holliday junction resolvase)
LENAIILEGKEKRLSRMVKGGDEKRSTKEAEENMGECEGRERGDAAKKDI